MKLSEDGKILRKNFWVTQLDFFGKSIYRQITDIKLDQDLTLQSISYSIASNELAC